jgi:hypothetical protein
MKKQQQQHHELQNADFTVWRVMQEKRREHEEQVRRSYNNRSRQRLETHH